MDLDFTISIYKKLLQSLKEDYGFVTVDEFIGQQNLFGKLISLRHDVDLLPGHSLRFARIQHEMGIRGTYYFRAVPQSWDETIIKEIASLGHEVGYHYECLTSTNGNLEEAITDFEKNLGHLRQLVPVSTICMHGSPMSKYDSKDIWEHYKYEDYGIVGEPYFDIDFRKVFYLTDTGRRWDGGKSSVRDKVDSGFRLSYHYTDEIIKAAEEDVLPDKIMFTFHPQRWNDDFLKWLRELGLQRSKNVVKRLLFVKNNSKVV